MSSRPSRGAARLASILDALPDALLLVDVNGTVVNANAIAIETFESPGTGLVGRGLLDLLPSFDSKRIPGSMRSPREAAEDTRTKPTRMVARRTDGSEFPVEVTSANLADPRTPYADFGDPQPSHFTGDELLMLVVRDLTGTLDTEAELARQQRQTEMILRAAAEGVVGVDTAGKVVLVNPSAAQILGHRATDLGGKELHPLVHHSRADGTPLPYEETPLADTLRSGRKHRVRGQVLWRKDGRAVPVDLTTAPVREGDQLVGAVMTFTDRTSYDALAARTGQLQALLDTSLRGPLAELRGELTGLAADPAGHLWPEANQILHHLAAGYARITTLIDNVLAFQRLDRGEDKLRRETVGLDKVVSAAVEGAIELIGPGRAQYAVHAPPIEASIDAERMAQALAHLISDVAGVDSAGNAIAYTGDSTIVVAAAKRGDVIRIDVRGPHAGGDPVHLPLARGIVERHGGVLQTHEVPGQGSAYVLEVPVGKGNGSAGGARSTSRTGSGTGGGSGTGAGRDSGDGSGPGGSHTSSGNGSGSRNGSGRGSDGGSGDTGAGGSTGSAGDDGPRESDTTVMPVPSAPARGTAPGSSAAHSAPSAGSGNASGPRPPRPRQAADDTGTMVAPWSIPAAADQDAAPTGRRRARRRPGDEADGDRSEGRDLGGDSGGGRNGGGPSDGALQPTGRRARRVPADDQGSGPAAGPAQQQRAELPAPPIPNALPPAQSDPGGGQSGRQSGQQAPEAGTGRRARRAIEPPSSSDDGGGAVPPAQSWPAAPNTPAPGPAGASGAASASGASGPSGQDGASRPALPAVPSQPAWPAAPQEPRVPGQDPAEAQAHAQAHAQSSHSRAISVRTLGQGVPFAQQGAGNDPQTQTQAVQAQTPQGLPAQVSASGSGRRRRLNPPQSAGHGPGGEPQARQHPQADPDSGQLPVRRPDAPQQQPEADATDPETALLRPIREGGRAYAIGAPAAGADEGPEPLDGPNGAVDVTDVAHGTEPADAADDHLEMPLDEPRRLLVWPEPDVSTRQALTDRGYRPVIVRSREEVDAQVAEPPAALFVDPLTGPITRTALQALRQAAAAADVPVLVTAGLGQATREAAYGADPAVLLKALAPRDSEQHPPRVLLVEGHAPIAQAFAATLERRGMQVTHADSESDAMTKAAQVHPNLVVMDLMLIRRRRQGIVDWLRGNARLNNTPLVVYTSADIDPAELPRLASGETVLFLAERSTSPDVQSRIVDLLAKIGT